MARFGREKWILFGALSVSFLGGISIFHVEIIHEVHVTFGSGEPSKSVSHADTKRVLSYDSSYTPSYDSHYTPRLNKYVIDRPPYADYKLASPGYTDYVIPPPGYTDYTYELSFAPEGRAVKSNGRKKRSDICFDAGSGSGEERYDCGWGTSNS